MNKDMGNFINTQSGVRLTFYKLFSEKNYRIQVPVIQRDYAQGRKSSREIRNTFLDALHMYLNENKPNRDLDFIYGSLVESDMTAFIPLDGQQRLTTLFLLHWYLYQISDNAEKKEEFKNAIFRNGKSMFSYETRSSSSEFCNALMANNIKFDELLEPDFDFKNTCKENSLSKTIKNCSWFYLSWQYDPTIQSMLTMIDAIHKRFADNCDFFERLIDSQNPIITFLFLNLQDFKLTDDLYIKMNSRGKPLTSFENLKAKFEEYIGTIKTKRRFLLKYTEKEEKEVSLREYFSYNIDTKWANLFWNYRTCCSSNNTFDDELMNFIRAVFTNQYAINLNSAYDRDVDFEYLLGTADAKKEVEYNDSISFNKYEELKALSEEGVLYLIDALDSLVNGNEKIKCHLGDYKYYYDEVRVFDNTLKHDYDSNNERVCFHAYIRFLIFNKNDIGGIKQWMRVIHNLTHPENTIIDSSSRVAAVIRSIEELLPYSNNILEYLMTDCNIASFSKYQVLEEKVKAHLVVKNDDWSDKIKSVEKHGYFNGQIGFILEFAGILEYYNTMGNCDWTIQEDCEYFRLFSDYADKASLVFYNNYEERVNNINNVFERAVLTKGDYLTTASDCRKNLLSTNQVKNNIKRDHSWKRLLRISDDGILIDKHLFVKQVFDDSRFDKNELVDSLGLICKDKTNSWRDYIISCPSLIRYCNQGFIRHENDNFILLYGESRRNHMHVEMYSYYLWKIYLEERSSNFKPFKLVQYHESKGMDEYPHITFSGLCHNNINYRIELYYFSSHLKCPYEIVFKSDSEDILLRNYSSEIQEILDIFDFKNYEDTNSYYIKFDNGKELIEYLELFVKEIDEIENLSDNYPKPLTNIRMELGKRHVAIQSPKGPGLELEDNSQNQTPELNRGIISTVAYSEVAGTIAGLNKDITNANKSPRTNLKVTLPNGKIIVNNYAYETFLYVVIFAGVDQVRALGLTQCNMPLITNKKIDLYNQKEISEGLYLMTHSSTKDKKIQIEKISEILGLGLTVEII